jgi:hypothetical protein
MESTGTSGIKMNPVSGNEKLAASKRTAAMRTIYQMSIQLGCCGIDYFLLLSRDLGAKRRKDKINRVPDDRLFFSHCGRLTITHMFVKRYLSNAVHFQRVASRGIPEASKRFLFYLSNTFTG